MQQLREAPSHRQYRTHSVRALIPSLAQAGKGNEITNMSANLLPYALTTLARVKDRIFDTNVSAQPTAFDDVLTRMINSVTDWFERETGARRFVQTLYSNEIYSAVSGRQLRVVTRKSPIFFATITGDTIAGSATIQNVSSTVGMVVGMPVASDNIIPTTVVGANQLRNYIAAIGNTSITLAAAASATGTSAVLQVNGLINFQWRTGTPATNPSWINFIPDQYELVNDGKAGVIRVYGFIPRLRENMIRVTYYAGYPIDWAQAGNGTTHQLPSDISDTVENIVVRTFKRRQLAGKASEGAEGATTAWNKEIDANDRDVIGHYRRISTIF